MENKMNLLKNIFYLVVFFILGTLLATSIVVMFFWNRTTIDSLFLYITTATTAGSYIKNVSLATVICITFVYTFISFFCNKKWKMFLIFLSLSLFFYTFQIYDFIVGNTTMSSISSLPIISAFLSSLTIWELVNEVTDSLLTTILNVRSKVSGVVFSILIYLSEL